MYDKHAFGARRYRLFDLLLVDLIGIEPGFDQYGSQAVFRNGQDGGDVGIGRNDDLVTRSHYPHFDVGTENPYQRIQSVGTAHRIARSDIPCIILLEMLVLYSLQVPSRIDDSVDSCVDFVGIFCRDSLQI